MRMSSTGSELISAFARSCHKYRTPHHIIHCSSDALPSTAQALRGKHGPSRSRYSSGRPSLVQALDLVWTSNRHAGRRPGDCALPLFAPRHGSWRLSRMCVGVRAERTWRTWSVRELSVTMCPPTVTVKLAADRGDGTAPLSRLLLRRSLTLWSTTRGSQ